jgi:hypothetical protein
LSRRQRLAAWFQEATNLRRFAAWNIVIWLANQPLIFAWYIIDKPSFVNGLGVLYVAQVSAIALWLSSLAWWQSTRVEERQIEAEEPE